ncbi:uncharacterized protein LOC6580535 [Drosophila mojavensis]|uniref:Uncharacterized protein n=1 Tax=Drosophila mojavensis TaxID=7230 RepID=B4KQG1_DROMO|nr:uncharacterized protein LOC6580535 [Drosophila mojavensis]EDW10301.1 uncharacterized protein Dmoj_GI21002 [Drosophila mojavensis]
MKRLNICGAFLALSGPGTKEDIIIQVAKQQNIRFNDLPQLQKEVDRALEESLRLGFVDRQGQIYKLNIDVHNKANAKNSTNNKSTSASASVETTMQTHPTPENKAQGQGQGDSTRSRSLVDNCSRIKSRTSSCSACSALDFISTQDRRKNTHFLDKHLLRKEKSVCSICGLNSDKRSVDGQEPETTTNN